MEEWQFSYQSKDTLTMWTDDCALGIYPKSLTTLHTNPHMNIVSSFIHINNCPYLEATNISFDNWVEK